MKRTTAATKDPANRDLQTRQVINTFGGRGLYNLFRYRELQRSSLMELHKRPVLYAVSLF